MTGERRNDGATMAKYRADSKITIGSIGKHVCCSCTAVALLWCMYGVGADKEKVPSTAQLESSLFAVFAAQRFRYNYTEV